jgi:hypothetical protein
MQVEAVGSPKLWLWCCGSILNSSFCLFEFWTGREEIMWWLGLRWRRVFIVYEVYIREANDWWYGYHVVSSHRTSEFQGDFFFFMTRIPRRWAWAWPIGMLSWGGRSSTWTMGWCRKGRNGGKCGCRWNYDSLTWHVQVRVTVHVGDISVQQDRARLVQLGCDAHIPSENVGWGEGHATITCNTVPSIQALNNLER